MKTSEFVQLLQNELILPRDPHLADRFAALLEENYEPVAPKEPTPERRREHPSPGAECYGPSSGGILAGIDRK